MCAGKPKSKKLAKLQIGKKKKIAIQSRLDIMEEEKEEKGEKKMKVQNITDVEGLFKVIDECKGKVELVTGEGDRLNLKSKLSQYVSLANIFSHGEIPELELIAHEKEDVDKLIDFIMRG